MKPGSSCPRPSAFFNPVHDHLREQERAVLVDHHALSRSFGPPPSKRQYHDANTSRLLTQSAAAARKSYGRVFVGRQSHDQEDERRHHPQRNYRQFG